MTCPVCGVETNQFKLSKVKHDTHDIWVCLLCRFWENERRGELIVGSVIALLTGISIFL